MNETTKITIREALITCGNMLWSDSLFLPDTDEWNLETQGLIWDPDDVECDEDEVPKIAKDNKLFCSLGVGTLQEIVDNAKQQIAECSVEQLFEAFLYYWNNDAFISFDEV